MVSFIIMRIGSFELLEPLPQLRRPHAIVTLKPWVDVGGAASLAVESVEKHLQAQELGSLASPGVYFDFTQYRPRLQYVDGRHQTMVPNVKVRSATGPEDIDFLFIHLMEPHAMAEEYITAVVALLQHMEVQRYCRIGSMWSDVPHTRPLPVMASINGEDIKGLPGVFSMRRPPYRGRTSIMNMVGDRVSELGIENANVTARLPSYARMEEDHTGKARLLSVLCSLYNLPVEVSADDTGQEQYRQLSVEMEQNPEVMALVKQLEEVYDAWMEDSPPQSPPSSVPPAFEEFLNELEERSNGS